MKLKNQRPGPKGAIEPVEKKIASMSSIYELGFGHMRMMNSQYSHQLLILLQPITWDVRLEPTG
jgi:hypothetical protein